MYLRTTEVLHSADEVHHDQMKNYMGKNEIGKCSFWSNANKFIFILWVDLDAQTNCKAIRSV